MRCWKTIILFYIGGMLYVLVEWLWRGWSHPSMFLLGGLCFVLLGWLNEGTRPELPMWIQSLFGSCVVTALELAAGLIVNIRLGLGVWDYSHLPLNFMGQICLYFFLLWIPLCALAIVADDWLRHVLFGEPRVRHQWGLFGEKGKAALHRKAERRRIPD